MKPIQLEHTENFIEENLTASQLLELLKVYDNTHYARVVNSHVDFTGNLQWHVFMQKRVKNKDSKPAQKGAVRGLFE